MDYKKYEFPTYNVYTIKTNRFRNCYMEIIFRDNIEKEKITAKSLLTSLLSYSSKKYPATKDVAIKLEELYDASFGGVTTRVGSTIFTNYSMDFLNPRYFEKGYLNDVLSFPFEMIYNPDVKNNAFNSETFNIIKNKIEADIKRSNNNPSLKTIRTALNLVDDKCPSSYFIIGDEENLENLTPKKMYEYYQEVLQHEACDIYVIGDLDMDEVVDIISKNNQLITIKDHKIDLYCNPKSRKKPLITKEEDKNAQSYYAMICNLIDLTEREEKYVMPIYNIILGAGSLDTKLAKSLREENSLCYSVNSFYQKYDRLLLIDAGIEENQFEKAISLSKKALKEMQDGNISDEELANAKLTIKSSLAIKYDNPVSLINNYVFQNIGNLDDLEKRLPIFNSVTKEEIIKVADKVKINTIYLLGGGE